MIKIYTDSCSDIPSTNLPNDTQILPLHYSFTGENVEYGENMQLPITDFFAKISEGKIPSTSSINPSYALERFTQDALLGNDIICICLSSKLSSTYQNILLAKEELLENFPNTNIFIVDSLTGSLAEGLLVLKADSLKREGKNFNEIVNYIETYKKYYQINFFVDDLKYLQRNGRISKSACAIGTTLGIKPLIHVGNDGFPKQLLNSRGIKKCDHILLDKLEKEVDENEAIGIVHFADLDSALRLEEKIKELGLHNPIMIGEISPAIATHIGPNAYGLTYKVKQKK